MIMELTVTINKLDESEPHQLYHRYPGQTNPQGCYIGLDTRDGSVWADWDGEIGNAVPMSVWHGLVRRWHIPPLLAAEVNRLLDEIKPLLQRVIDGAEAEWDGNNIVGRYDDDAQDAAAEINQIIEARYQTVDDGLLWEPQDWWWQDGMKAVCVDSTDEEIEAMVDADIAGTERESPTAVIDRDAVLALYMAERDYRREEEDEED